MVRHNLLIPLVHMAHHTLDRRISSYWPGNSPSLFALLIAIARFYGVSSTRRWPITRNCQTAVPVDPDNQWLEGNSRSPPWISFGFLALLLYTRYTAIA